MLPASTARLTTLLAGLVACLALSACVDLKAYRVVAPPPSGTPECRAIAAPSSPATENEAGYTLHYVEFDDQGAPFDCSGDEIDAAVDQIKAMLNDPTSCVRLFVYVHGWRHNAREGDSNVGNFKNFLAAASSRARAAAGKKEDACDDPTVELAARAPASEGRSAKQAARRTQPARSVKTVGLYVGWRGLSIVDSKPLVYLSFWDRKNTADRVAQGSVRELFARLSALAAYAPAADKVQTDRLGTNAQLRTYVIGHSFGAAIVFRALSQSTIEGFTSDLDRDLASISRFVDMVVLVNPAIEAARFAPVFRAARKRVEYCDRPSTPHAPCSQPRYQAPVLAIFSSEGDQATGLAFPLGAGFSNTFERTLNDAEYRAIHSTIGWDDDLMTHRLRGPQACDPIANPGPNETFPDGTARYRGPGWTWCIGDLALTQLGGVPKTDGSAPIYNGPLWNIRVDKTIIADHSDIWNERFRAVLLRLFADEEVFTALPPTR